MIPKLGLCKLPEPIYLFVRNSELDGSTYCWHYWDHQKETAIPEPAPAVCGYLSEVRVTTKEFKSKDNIKLDIVVSGDEVFIIRTGIETCFAKSFLLAIAEVKDLSKPLIIGCSPGKENSVFCNLYDASTKSRIETTWNAHLDCLPAITAIQQRLQTKDNTLIRTQSPRCDRTSLMKTSNTLIDALGWSAEDGRAYLLEHYGMKSRTELSDEELLDFVGQLQKMKLPARN